MIGSCRHAASRRRTRPDRPANGERSHGPSSFRRACRPDVHRRPAAFGADTLTILHTNDFHSRVEPINKFDSTCTADEAAEKACFGGSARLKTAIDRERAKAPASILVDAGDQSQGSLFYTYYGGKAEVEMMNRLGYQAMALGNHEFDRGPAGAAVFLDTITFPMLLANGDTSKEPLIAGRTKPSIILDADGDKVGVIGLSTVETPEVSSSGPTVVFTDPAPALSREIAALKGQGVERIVVLSHSGYGVEKELAAKVPGIDIIVGGHSHTFLSSTEKDAEGPYPTMVDGPEGKVAVVSARSYGKYLGALTVRFDGAGRLTEASGAPILLDASIAEDGGIKARVAELAKPLQEIRDKVVAHSADAIDGSRETCRAKECAMGNLVAEAILDHVKGQGTQIAIVNGGGLRASIDAGDVTMGEVLTVLPFQNTLSTFELTGADIKAALENGVSKVEEGSGRFPQVAGLKFTWSKAGKPGIDRIRSVEVKQGDAFVPLDPAKTYLVVSNNFMRGGGDGYTVFTEKGMKAYDYGPSLEDAVAAYLGKTNAAYEPHTDGRISEVD
ncbi:bifunctional metallophosphatase/5'-nucleotidase [Mangrovicella endophytica]|uniref:bifunctional metallophosphatase/5'-nucleotidase n=1 Tax=Mangrovicella endophytica TaxID=2066697 RepID=UPI000C9E5ADE|nr:5'-nucleotidase C-terminal domain-containing protein [Mangrovicella endophytica]